MWMVECVYVTIPEEEMVWLCHALVNVLIGQVNFFMVMTFPNGSGHFQWSLLGRQV